ncbi:MAG: SHOCT domain-containing protein [Desulfofustis sp.]|jgi:putative membrane protein|nr:SHOCT domain-containing protein [Desulfofustis sp.]
MEISTMYGQRAGASDWLCGFGAMFPHPFGMILTIIFWLVVIVLVVKLFQYLFSATSGRNESSSLKIAKDRYAAGEISKEEFQQLKKDLT